MTRRLLAPNERDPALWGELYGTRCKALLQKAAEDTKGPTFPPPLVEGEIGVFALYRRLQSAPFLQLRVQAICVNGRLQWALGHLETRERISVDLFPGHGNTLSLT